MTSLYLYALVDPRNDAIRYVGMTNNPPQRYANHLHEARKDTHTRKRAWIRSITKLGLEPVFSVIRDDIATDEELATQEILTIAEYALQGHDLTNLSEGGEGIRGFAAPRTEEWRRKLSEATKRYYESLTHQERSDRSLKRLESILANNGGVYPGYTKGYPSHSKGKTLPESTKQRMRESHKRRWERIRAEGRYEEVCANIAAGTERARRMKEAS